jgi:zinc protease
MAGLKALIMALLVVLVIPATAFAITVKMVHGPPGVEAWLSEEHALPMIAVDVSLPAGSAYDPVTKQGLAAMLAALLDEGAGDLRADAFKQALESRAIRFSAIVERDYIVLSLITLTENADEAFRLLGLALAQPRFDSDAVERMRVALLANIKEQEESPSDVAEKAWYAEFFGTHPYAHPPSGTRAGIASITVADLRDFATEHLVRDGIKVAVSGDIAQGQLARYLQSVFEPLPATTVPAIPPAPAAGARAYTVPRDEAAPVSVFGFAGPMRADPDFIPTYVANYIFGGGGFSARLMDQVRDKRGLTYGISTDLDDFRSAAIILGEVQSDKSKILSAMDVTKSEMARFMSGGATAKELADAKTYLTGSFPLTLDSDAKIARTLNAFQRSGLSADYVEKRNRLIQSVTLAQVNAMAKKYYEPARIVSVIAGTPSGPAAAPPPKVRPPGRPVPAPALGPSP